MNFVQIIEIPEVSIEEYADQLEVSVEEALGTHMRHHRLCLVHYFQDVGQFSH